MREEEMREVMQGGLAVPEKVHDAFERGIEEVLNMDMNMEQKDMVQETEEKRSGNGAKGRRIFWRRAAVAAAVVAAVCAIGFHSRIYSFARSLFVRSETLVEDKKVREDKMKIFEINDDVIPNEMEKYTFESLADVEGKLGVSFLHSSRENQQAGKGRVIVLRQPGERISVRDSVFCVHAVSNIVYGEKGSVNYHEDNEESYSISCTAEFLTEDFEGDKGVSYQDASFREEYETKNGLQATLIQWDDSDSWNAVLYHDGIRYTYETDDAEEGAYTLQEFKSFLDTLTD